MDPPIFHVEDYLHDLFAPDPTGEPIPAKGTVSVPTVVTVTSEPALIFEPRLSKPAPFEPIHAESDASKASKLEPMQAEGSGVPEPVNIPELTSGLASSESTIAPEMPISEPSQIELR